MVRVLSSLSFFTACWLLVAACTVTACHGPAPEEGVDAFAVPVDPPEGVVDADVPPAPVPDAWEAGCFAARGARDEGFAVGLECGAAEAPPATPSGEPADWWADYADAFAQCFAEDFGAGLAAGYRRACCPGYDGGCVASGELEGRVDLVVDLEP